MLTLIDLEGRVAVATEGAQGISPLAECFSAPRATMLLCDRELDLARGCADTLGSAAHGHTVEVSEIAALAAWAASDNCSFATGFVLDISGGWTTH